MKDKLVKLFLRFVKATFSRERMEQLVCDLLDILYELYPDDFLEGSETDVSDSVQ